jgi:ankyrin repeat protein
MRVSIQFAIALGMAASCLAASDSRLIDAVKRRDRKAVYALLGQHANVNTALPDGSTPLAWAAYLDEPEIAGALVGAGANVNAADSYGETPLTLACASDGALAVQLLQAGADAKAARWNGETALMIAAGAGSVDAVRDLIAHGADVNAAGGVKKQTALMWAAAEGHSDVVRALIEKGANVNAVSASGFTPVLFAAIKDDAKSVKSLIAAHADPNYVLRSGASVLTVAASYGNTASVKALADAGANVNVADRTGKTALHTAAQLGNVEMVKILLAKGANPNARTVKTKAGGGEGFRLPTGELTPLHFAARGNHVEAMKLLLAGGADPSLRGQDGTSLLMSAVASSKPEVVKFTYPIDPHVDVVTDRGTTLIHASVSGGANGATQSAQDDVCEVIQFLADKGAKLDELDKAGKTPIDLADVLPIDKAVDLLTVLITKSGATPKAPSRR